MIRSDFFKKKKRTERRGLRWRIRHGHDAEIWRRGKWRRTKPRPSSERRRSGVSLGLALETFLGFSWVTDFERLTAALVSLEFDGRDWEDEGQSRDQWPGRPHLKQPVGAAFAFSITISIPFYGALSWNQSIYLDFFFFSFRGNYERELHFMPNFFFFWFLI